MKGFSKVIVALCLVATKTTFAIRQNKTVAALASADETDAVSQAIVAADEVTVSLLEGKKITESMMASLSPRANEFAEEVCSATDDESCRAAVQAYVDRCLKEDCFTIDNENYPKDDEFQPLLLPNPFQLDAAFRLFQSSEVNTAKDPVVRFWMRFKHGGRYGAYRTFIINLLKTNLAVYEESNDVWTLVNRYLYTSTTYYKTFTQLDGVTAQIIDTAAFTRHILGRPIKAMLLKIIRRNLPSDFGEYNVSRLHHMVKGYGEYMQRQVPSLPTFASKFSAMAVKSLLKTVGLYQSQPWYKKWFSSLKKFFTYKVGKPTKEYYLNKIHKPAKEYLVNQVHVPMKNFYLKKVHEPTKEFYLKKVHEPTKEFITKVHEPVSKFYMTNIHEPGTKFYMENIHEPTKTFFKEGVGAPITKFGKKVNKQFEKMSTKLRGTMDQWTGKDGTEEEPSTSGEAAGATESGAEQTTEQTSAEPQAEEAAAEEQTEDAADEEQTQ